MIEENLIILDSLISEGNSLKDNASFETLFQCAPLPYQSLNEKGNIIMVNKAWLEVLGYDKVEVIGKWFGNFLAPEFDEYFKNSFSKFKETGKINNIEFEMIRKDGEIIHVSFNLQITCDRKGNFVRAHCIFTDITEYKEAKEALEESLIRYRTLFQGATDGIFLMKDYKFIECNDRTLEIFGCDSPEDILGKKPWDFSREKQPDGSDSKNRAIQIIDLALVGEVQKFYWKHTKKDGTPFDAEISLSLLLIKEQKYLQAIVRDITERKKAEKALLEANNIINRSPAVAFLWNNIKGWPVEFVSENVEGLFGYSAEDFLSGMISYGEVVHIDDLGKVADEIQRNSEDFEISSFRHEPYRIITNNGEEKWVQDITHIRRDKDGKVTHFEGIVYDITEQVLAETAMRESEYKFRAVFHEALDGIVLSDAINGIIVDCNPQFEHITGRSLSELRTLHIWDIRPEELVEDAKKMFDTLKRYGIGESSEHKIQRPDGSLIPIEFKARIINVRGNDYILSINRDITERLEAEKIKVDKEVAEARYTLTKIMTDIVPALMTMGPQMAAGRHEVTREMMRRVDLAFFDKYFPEENRESIGLNSFGKQMCRLFNDMGGEFEYSIDDGVLTIEAHICPWQNQEAKNPILCILGRGIIERFGTKLFGNATIQQENNLAKNGKYCYYKFHVMST